MCRHKCNLEKTFLINCTGNPLDAQITQHKLGVAFSYLEPNYLSLHTPKTEFLSSTIHPHACLLIYITPIHLFCRSEVSWAMRSYSASMKNISVDLSTEVVSLLCRYSKGRQSDKNWFRTSITGNHCRMEKAWATAIVRGSRTARISQRPWRNIRESIRHVAKLETKKRIRSDLPCFEWRVAWHTRKSYRSSRKILLLNWTRFLIFSLHRVDSNLLPTSYLLISSVFLLLYQATCGS